MTFLLHYGYYRLWLVAKSLAAAYHVMFVDSVNGSDWSYFSATCWFFGRNLFDSRQYPIGKN